MMPLPTSVETLGLGHFRFQVEAQHHVFQGHFPDDPILPGLAQVDWAIRLGEQAFGPLGAFTGLSNLKFMQIIKPGESIELQLTHNAAKGALAFEFLGDSGRKSSGIINFASRP